jgi:hypothetical protein
MHAEDEMGRKTVMDYLKDFEGQKIFPVGRLDYDTEDFCSSPTTEELAISYPAVKRDSQNIFCKDYGKSRRRRSCEIKKRHNPRRI